MHSVPLSVLATELHTDAVSADEQGKASFSGPQGPDLHCYRIWRFGVHDTGCGW